MQKITPLKLVGALAGILLTAALLYQLPPIKDRLSWRLDLAMTFLRGSLIPAGPLPSPAATAALVATPSTTPLPSPTTITTPATLPTPTATPLPTSIILSPPKWEQQKMNNCGPAALAMYLRYYGWEGNQLDIARLLKPAQEDRNVNVEELVYYTRTHAGWLKVEYRVGGTLDLLKQLLIAGMPVMIEESFYFTERAWINDDLWGAHYQLITGYDDSDGVFIGQDSFHGPDQRIPYTTVDKYWQAFNRVFIIIYPPEKEETVKNILGSDWDMQANRQHALDIAQAETIAEANNAFAWFNLGTNLVYFERYHEAAQAYDKARAIGLPQRMLRYQFGPFIAYFHALRTEDLLALTDYALKITPNSEEALLWRGWALYRMGKTSQARTYFQMALDANPKYQDALYALDFLKQVQ